MKLHSICSSHPYEEKVLLVSQYATGQQILEAYTKAGFATINLKVKTVLDVALDMLDSRSVFVENRLEETVGAQLVYLVLTQLKEGGMLRYFDQMEITSSFSRGMYQTIHTLRMAGYQAESLRPEMFVTKEKGEDMVRILTEYEKLLSTYQKMDDAQLLKMAMAYEHKTGDVLYVLQSNLSLTYTEEEFLRALLPDEVEILPLPPVYGISIPKRSGLGRIVFGEATPLSYLYDLHSRKGNADVSVFAARTEETELKQVLQQIKQSGEQLDEYVIFYTSSEKYLLHSYHLAKKLDIPVTFGEGIPISLTRPGRLAAGVLTWMRENYSTITFVNLLQEGLLNLGDEAPNRTRMIHLLRDAGIGWGKERYVPQLQAYIDMLEKKMERAEPDRKEYYTKQIDQAKWTLRWFERLMKKMPPFEEKMVYKEALVGMSYIIKNFCRTSSAADELAKQTMLTEIEKVLPYADEAYGRFSLFDKLSDLLLSLRILSSGPKPGHLHITSYLNGVYQARKNVSIVGLDNHSFPGEVTEDPLLLDTERERLGRDIPLLQSSGQERLYTMVQLLTQCEGRVTMSYCNFSISDNRVIRPAFLLLQTYRFVTGQPDCDFNKIAQLPSPLIPDTLFQKRDYWGRKFMEEKKRELQDDLLQQFPGLDNGLKAEHNRILPEFTTYDGLVSVDPSLQDQDRVMTASKLETLATCPYSYFLGNILGVKPVEELVFDPNRWLDAATRGSLLHKIFELYYNESTINDKELIRGIAMDLIKQERELLPHPSERVYDMEVQDLLACCDLFVAEEEIHRQDYKPLYFEYAFGMNGKEPADVQLPSGDTLSIAGKIDRVDEGSSGTYQIIDYKTGSTYHYNRNKPFQGGRQLQHFVYALAIEQHLHLQAGSVAESAYYFPTVKGQGERFVRMQDDGMRSNGLAILEKLVAVLRSGQYVMTDNEEDCKFCPYKNVCRREFYKKDLLDQKRMDTRYDALACFRGVRAYD